MPCSGRACHQDATAHSCRAVALASRRVAEIGVQTSRAASSPCREVRGNQCVPALEAPHRLPRARLRGDDQEDRSFAHGPRDQARVHTFWTRGGPSVGTLFFTRACGRSVLGHDLAGGLRDYATNWILACPPGSRQTLKDSDPVVAIGAGRGECSSHSKVLPRRSNSRDGRAPGRHLQSARHEI